MKDIPRSEITPVAMEGDVIVLVGCGKYRVDKAETQRRKAEITKLMENMWE
jgi:Protein of unknown function (DUF3006).